jgi:MFS family permease
MKSRPPFFYGWLLVAIAAIGLLFGAFPIVVASFGVFFPSYIREFHAGRAAISLAFTIHNLAAAFASPIVGRLADRWGRGG